MSEMDNNIKGVFCLIIGPMLAACASAQPPIAPAPTVDPAQSIIFHNGVILTMVTDQPIVEAIAIRGEKIKALGSNEEILARQEAGTTVIDLAGRTLMSGFVDAHTHVLNDARSQDRSLDQAQMLALQNGKYADVIVISGNPLTAPADDLKSLSVLATMVGGRFEYCNPRYPELCPAYQIRTLLPLPDLRPPVLIRWLVLILVVVLPLLFSLWYWRSAARGWLTPLGGVAGVVGGGLWAWAIGFSTNDSNDLSIRPLLSAGALLACAVVGLASVERPSRLGGLGLIAA